MIKLTKINNSFTEIVFNETPKSQSSLKQLKQVLSIEREGWQFDHMVKIGRKSKYDFHFEQAGENTILVSSGILEIPPIREILNLPALESFEKEEEEIQDFLDDLIEQDVLPFLPYDYQLLATKRALAKKQKLSLMCTGSGKSLTISLCLEYFRQRKMKGVLVVPNINLLTQFSNDILSYNLKELHESIITFGGGSKKLKQLKDSGQQLQPGDLVITTWQSLSKLEPKFFTGLDYVICDEVHKFSSKCTSQLVLDSMHATFKLGFTGTLPDSKSAKMTLIGLFGLPDVIVTPQDLISSGRGTPIHITGVKLKHTAENSAEVSRSFEFLDKLKATIAIPERTQYIVNLANQMSLQKSGSSLVLFTLLEHGFEIFRQLWLNKTQQELSDINDLPSIEEMNQYSLFFMNGQTTGKVREQIRVLMDSNPEAILVANYALLSTGVNIKSLRYAIFASPVKSGVTVAQSLGRGIRLSDGKDVFNVYDIVDVFGGTRMFQNQFNARKNVYNKSGFTLDERVETLQ